MSSTGRRSPLTAQTDQNNNPYNFNAELGSDQTAQTEQAVKEAPDTLARDERAGSSESVQLNEEGCGYVPGQQGHFIQIQLAQQDANIRPPNALSNSALISSTRPQRVKRPPAHLKDYICHTVKHAVSSPLHDNSLGTSHPISHFISYNRFSPTYHALLTVITSNDQPKHFS